MTKLRQNKLPTKKQPVFKLIRGSTQAEFLRSRNKIQIFGGAYGNGKTTSSVMKTLQIAKDYPGINCLLARETLSKLNDTLRTEFIKWCPPSWIYSFPQPPDKSSTCTLKNGSMINFRYIVQQGKQTAEMTSSNLLSANYGLVVVDQMESPGIEFKDFSDLLGRLRQQADYVGDDPTMPRTGPRWFIITCNPARNWLYKKLVQPVLRFQARGERIEGLLVDKYGNLLIDLFVSDIYENKDNLPLDFIETLEAQYTGQMRDRFIGGQWAAYEGLVYPMYDDRIHRVPHAEMLAYLRGLRANGYEPNWLAAYDYGMAAPAVYELAFVDIVGNVHVIDGFYAKELAINGTDDSQIERIYTLNARYDIRDRVIPKADPSIFKRSAVRGERVGESVADIFFDNGAGLLFQKAANGRVSGISQMRSYLQLQSRHTNPYTGKKRAPHLYVSDHFAPFHDEIADYYWARDKFGEPTDEPVDRNDHAMDCTKYLLADRPAVHELGAVVVDSTPGYLRGWHEQRDTSVNTIRECRYG